MKKVKIITMTLAIVLITMIAFFGIYVQVQNRMENQVKDYSYAMDLKGNRQIRLKVNTESKTEIKDAEGNTVNDADELTDEQLEEKGYKKEETPYNSENVRNIESYKKSQKIIEERLKKLGVDNYIIKLDEQTGDIIVELTENEQTDSVISNINTTGKFEIIDSETQEVLMNNNDIKLARVMYGSSSSTTSSGTTVYLDIQFTKEGTKKLEEISNKYVKTENTDNENSSDENETQEDLAEGEVQEDLEEGGAQEDSSSEEEETTEKTITMNIDDEEIMTTSFDETIKTGKLQLSIGSSTTDTDALQDYINQASNMANVLDTGNIPVKYDLSENEYIISDITDNEMQVVQYIVLGMIAIALIILIIRYKALGILGVISYIGLASIYMIVIRYANVVLSIEGLFGIAITLILNYVFMNKILLKLQKKEKEIDIADVKNANIETLKEFFIKILPVIIMVISFCFVTWAPISSFGMVMFWGILLMAIYNSIVTNNLLKIKARKEKQN